MPGVDRRGYQMSKVFQFDEDAAQDIERTYHAPEIVRQRMRTLEALALKAGEAVLDVGCGTGLLTHDMALEVGPEGRVVGIDNTPSMLRRAEERCTGLHQVHLKDGVVEDLPESDQSFDAVACVQVLLYVADVPKALAEMHRVLKFGGRIAVLETDWRGAVFNSSDQSLTRRMLTAWDDAVPSPNLPVRLGPLLQERGFSAIRVEAIPVLNTSSAPGNFSVNTVKWLVRVAQEQGSVSKDQARAWLEDLQRLGRDGAYFFCVNRFLFCAVRL